MKAKQATSTTVPPRKPRDRVLEVRFVEILPNGSSLGLWHEPKTVQIASFR